MSHKVDTLGPLLGGARASLGSSLQEVAEGAGCSPAYVHKLEQDRVRTPSPRVLAGLARTLGLEYDLVMRAAGYEGAPPSASAGPAAATSRFSNAHIVELLEELRSEIAALREELHGSRAPR